MPKSSKFPSQCCTKILYAFPKNCGPVLYFVTQWYFMAKRLQLPSQHQLKERLSMAILFNISCFLPYLEITSSIHNMKRHHDLVTGTSIFQAKKTFWGVQLLLKFKLSYKYINYWQTKDVLYCNICHEHFAESALKKEQLCTYISARRSFDPVIYLHVVLQVLKDHINFHFTNPIYFHNMQL